MLIKDGDGYIWAADVRVNDELLAGLEPKFTLYPKIIPKKKTALQLLQEQLEKEEKEKNKDKAIDIRRMKLDEARLKSGKEMLEEDEVDYEMYESSQNTFAKAFAILLLLLYYIMIIFMLEDGKNMVVPYYQNLAIGQPFEEFKYNFDNSFPDGVKINQKEVNRLDHIFIWLEKVFVPTIFSKNTYNYTRIWDTLNSTGSTTNVKGVPFFQTPLYNYGDENAYTSYYNQVLGRIRFIQYRIKNDTCEYPNLDPVLKTVRSGDYACYGKFSSGNRMTSDFGQYPDLNGMCLFTSTVISQYKSERIDS